MKKIIVYAIAVIVMAAIFAAFAMNGVILGGLPSGLIVFGGLSIARVITSKIDENKNNDR